MTSFPPNAALFGDTGPAGETVGSVYGPSRLRALGKMTNLYPEVVTSSNLETCLPYLRDIEVIFSTWGMLRLTPQQLDQLPNLKAVFYAAGTVKHFARPFLERDITVVSAWAANAIPVAEFTLGQILLANKGYFRNLREYRGAESYSSAFRGPGNYDCTVALLGAGQIGRAVIQLLKPFHLQVLVFDPFLTLESAALLGVEKVELGEAFERGDVVSNHLADLPSTEGLLRAPHFCTMPRNATFINTGRGRTVNERELAEVLVDRPDLTALLDVTEPEPCAHDSPLRQLPNVFITSHIAGAIGNEVGRVADYAMDEFQAWRKGQPLRFAVTAEMLKSMA